MTSIVDTWRLVHAEAFDAIGKPQPAPYGGANRPPHAHEQWSHDG